MLQCLNKVLILECWYVYSVHLNNIKGTVCKYMWLKVCWVNSCYEECSGKIYYYYNYFSCRCRQSTAFQQEPHLPNKIHKRTHAFTHRLVGFLGSTALLSYINTWQEEAGIELSFLISCDYFSHRATVEEAHFSCLYYFCYDSCVMTGTQTEWYILGLAHSSPRQTRAAVALLQIGPQSIYLSLAPSHTITCKQDIKACVFLCLRQKIKSKKTPTDPRPGGRRANFLL